MKSQEKQNYIITPYIIYKFFVVYNSQMWGYNADNKRRINMEFLNACENKNFKVLYDCLFNQRLQVKDGDNYKTVDFDLGPEGEISIYPSGALMRMSTRFSVRVMFVKNDGSILVDAYKRGLDDIGAQVYDVRGTAFTTGVMITIEYFNHEYEYLYYTYLGTLIKADSWEELNQKVEKYEQSIGTYQNKIEIPQNQSTPHTDFLMSCLNKVNDNQDTASL